MRARGLRIGFIGSRTASLGYRVDFDGVKASLPSLLQAVRSGSRYVKLDDGSQGGVAGVSGIEQIDRVTRIGCGWNPPYRSCDRPRGV